MVWIFLSVLIGASWGSERYVLPKDILKERDKVIKSKQLLDSNIRKTYFKLCNKKEVTDAEHIEMLAYNEITGLSCWQLTRY